jgi:hypothetical protein
MSVRTSNSPATSAKSWIIPAAAAFVLVAAVVSYGRTVERQAASGSPYYDKAVKEAINGLLNTGGATPAVAEAGIPPLPEGFSAADYYWCPTCKAYHKRDAAGAQPAVPAISQPVATGTAEVIPPLPANLSAADYYWCSNCKAYHPRNAQATATQPVACQGIPFPLPPAAH